MAAYETLDNLKRANPAAASVYYTQLRAYYVDVPKADSDREIEERERMRAALRARGL